MSNEIRVMITCKNCGAVEIYKASLCLTCYKKEQWGGKYNVELQIGKIYFVGWSGAILYDEMKDNANPILINPNNFLVFLGKGCKKQHYCAATLWFIKWLYKDKILYSVADEIKGKLFIHSAGIKPFGESE